MELKVYKDYKGPFWRWGASKMGRRWRFIEGDEKDKQQAKIRALRSVTLSFWWSNFARDNFKVRTINTRYLLFISITNTYFYCLWPHIFYLAYLPTITYTVGAISVQSDFCKIAIVSLTVRGGIVFCIWIDVLCINDGSIFLFFHISRAAVF